MSASAIDGRQYRKLLGQTLPTIVHDEKQNERYISLLEQLYDRGDPLSAEENELAELLTLLVEDFESKRYELPRSTPLDALQELMRANELMQKDLLDVFGTPSIVSEILSGKRDLSKDHVVKLARRFNVSPELFLDFGP